MNFSKMVEKEKVKTLVCNLIGYNLHILLFSFALWYGWNHIAWEFNFPTFNYWTCLAISFVLKSIVPKGK